MFTRTAAFYDALYHFKDYEVAANQLHDLVKSSVPDSRTLLDVACGTGKHIFYLQKYFQVEGLDIDEGLLEVAETRCPDVTFHHADMSDFTLGSSFDVVTCLFSSIAYVRTLDQLNKSIMAMSNHLNESGMLIIEPWLYPSQYWKNKLIANYYNGDDLKIAWMYQQKLENECSVFDINYLVGSAEGVDHFTESHVMGLWTDEEYRNAFALAGFKQVHYDSKGFFGKGVYYGVKASRHE